MSKSGFLQGLALSILFGATFSFYNSIIAAIVSVAIGAFIGGSKKAGGGIGFLSTPIILVTPVTLPALALHLAGGIDFLYLLILILGSMFNIYFTIVWIASIIVGIIVGHISMRYVEKRKSSTLIEAPFEGPETTIEESSLKEVEQL